MRAFGGYGTLRRRRLCAVIRALPGLLAIRGLEAAWIVETADGAGDVGERASLVVGADGVLHAAYCDAGPPGLKHAMLLDGVWTSEPVAAANVGAGSVSLAVHGAFRWIAFHEATERDILLAASDGGAWTTATVAADAAWEGGAALAADDAGHLHLVYAAENAVRYAFHDGSGWSFESVESPYSTGRARVCLAVDRAGRVHTACSCRVGWYKQCEVRYAVREAGVWRIEPLLRTADILEPSIAVDSGDAPHIVCRDWRAGEFHYFAAAPTGWVHDVTTDFVASRPSLRVDAGGGVHLAFHDGYAESLGYARFGPAGWEPETVAGAPDDDDDCHPSLALDAFGVPHIAYYDAAAGTLKHARMFGPVLATAPAGINVVAVEGGTPRPREILVRNAGDAELAFSLLCDAGWVGLDPVSGTSSGQACRVSVTFLPDGLEPGIDHAAEIVCSAPGTFGSPAAVPVVLHLLRDSDGDGMPDDWETDHGLDPDDPSDRDEDPDGDGVSNYREFLARTDPRDCGSCLRIVRVVPHGEGAVLHWTGVPPFSLWRRDQPQNPWELIASGLTGNSHTSETATANCWFRVEAEEP